jgi:peroxiredoxin Q/BCP
MFHDLWIGAGIMSETRTHEVGHNAPLFKCEDSNGTVHDLAAYTSAGKSVIVYFYPRDSTPGCTTQACNFRDNMALLSAEGYIVLGVSKGSEGSHEKFIRKQELNFPLLMDEGGELHEAYGTWRLKKNYGREYMGCSRSTFVIGPDGTFSWLRYNVKAKGHVSMLLRELSLNE